MKTLSVTSGIIAATAIIAACDSDPQQQPKEIAFAEYSLSGTGCEWKESEQSHDNELIIINNDDKMDSYILCPEGKSRPSIDFSQYSLLLVRGIHPYYTRPNKISLCRLRPDKYTLTINLPPHLAAVNTPWQAALIVDRTIRENNVELIITQEP
ncbi:hypothetical protein [Alistipes timonensis]|uniref:hypothetical protein n=1 Tax=Alistipes timonensis TaxID=1465754 RepID=UPI001896C7B2|nr:hypothetical protein [Alistipes timonensis]